MSGTVGAVSGLWSYPVKSFQGHPADVLEVGPTGVADDRRWSLVTPDGAKALSAKRYKRLLEASVDVVDGAPVVRLPDGRSFGPGPDGDAALSDWLGVSCRLAEAGPDTRVTYEMTFDPPDDTAEMVEIPAPPGSFVDLADVHLLSTNTLAGGRTHAPDLDWDVRRFRPNVVVDLPGADPFAEDAWAGTVIALGDVRIRVDQPTVRCAMPLRAQPASDDAGPLDAQPGLYEAMDRLHANHLGVYATVVEPGTIRVGDPVEVVGPA